MPSRNTVSVTQRDLDKHLERATREIEEFKYQAESEPDGKEPTTQLGERRIALRPLQSLDPPRAAETSFRLADRIQSIAPTDALYSDVENRVLRVLRRAIQVYFAIYDCYEDASGLGRLKADNQQGRLGASAEPELAAKVETASAASAFALSSYVLSVLAKAKEGEQDDVADELISPRSHPLHSKTQTLRSTLRYFHAAIESHVTDDASLLRAVRSAAREQVSALQAVANQLQYSEAFTRYEYRIESDDVVVSGFENPDEGVVGPVEIQTRRPEEVVGNHIAKLEASRIAQRLACYDLELGQNPFVELGGFVFSFIGDGSPGTGKTTLIQMVVSLLTQYCDVAQLPLRYQNFSVDEISDYQGRSGHNAKRFCRSILDRRVVGFGTVDDVDQVCGNRGDRNASSGQLEVTAVFMQELGGANTVVRGNASFGLFSNFPENVDDALRQRTQARFTVDGPQTKEDFTDLLHILLGENWEMPLGHGYEPLETQEIRRMIDQKYSEHDKPKSESLRAVFENELEKRGGKGFSTWRDFGEYLHAIGKSDPRFTGRAVKNVSDAVRSRMMDFDLPVEWLERNEAFFARPYSERLAMIRELQGKITPEIVMQEINRYADSEARYGDAAQQRDFDRRVSEILLHTRAVKHASKREP
jgi:hypothetical protein